MHLTLSGGHLLEKQLSRGLVSSQFLFTARKMATSNDPSDFMSMVCHKYTEKRKELRANLKNPRLEVESWRGECEY